jgi:hypothetical protein
MAHDSDAFVGHNGIKSNENVAVSKGKLSVMYSHGCSSSKRRKLYYNDCDDSIGVDVINVTAK